MPVFVERLNAYVKADFTYSDGGKGMLHYIVTPLPESKQLEARLVRLDSLRSTRTASVI